MARIGAYHESQQIMPAFNKRPRDYKLTNKYLSLQMLMGSNISGLEK
jgi:hypothetical protein